MLNAGWFIGTVCLLLCLGAVESVRGAVRLPAILGSGMVLQQDSDLCIWGWARPGEQVTVRLAGQDGKATAGPDGQWTVTLLPLTAGGPYQLAVQGAGEALVLDDVLVGEVWLCSGQSNMWWPVKLCAAGEQETREANWPRIRLFTAPVKPCLKPQQDVKGQWTACTPDSVKDFSAVAYYFGRYLHRELGVPIGLIHSSVGGTRIEAWTSREALEADPMNQPMLQQWDTRVAKYPQQAQEKYQRKLLKWEQKVQQAQTQFQPAPQKPDPPTPPEEDANGPTVLYNGMIAPLTPLAIRGVIWYQGESNASNAWAYRTLLPMMIHDWRQRWGRGDFPFLQVQLANFGPRQDDQPPMWAELREAQLRSLEVVNTAMAVAIDIGDANDIHPPNKQDVGKRLALAALATVYGKDAAFSGPIYRSMRVDGDSIVLSLDHVEGGLTSRDGQPLTGFAIAGEDRSFVDAQARIEGHTVVVSSPRAPRPVAVRYGWANNPPCNLYNAAGLPASPFRTDDWPLLTQPAQ